MKNRSFEEESVLILKGLKKAYVKMVKMKKFKNTPLVISKNGKVKLIPAEKIPLTVNHDS